MFEALKKESIFVEIYKSRSFKRSQRAYISQATFECLILLLAEDVFLANLLNHMGVADSLVGIIASFVTAAPLFQLFSIFLARKFLNTKLFAVPMHSLSMFSFMLLYIVPFTPFSGSVKTFLVILFMLSGYLLQALCVPLIFKWANSFVHPRTRAVYSAKKEIISLFGMMVFSLAMGLIVDKFSENNNIEGGFLFVAASILLLMVFNFISLMLIKSKAHVMDFSQDFEESADTVSFKDAVFTLFKNKNFVNVIFMTILSSCAGAATLGFLGTYKFVDLGISVGLAQIINIVAYLFRMAVSIPFGKISDRKSFAYGINVGFLVAALSYLVLIFTAPNTWWLIIVYTILFNISQAGTSQNSTNILYSYVEDKYFSQAMSIKNCVGGVSVILTTFISSKVLSLIQENGNMLFGVHVYAQQFLALVSTVLFLLTVIFVRLTLQKQNTRY